MQVNEYNQAMALTPSSVMFLSLPTGAIFLIGGGGVEMAHLSAAQRRGLIPSGQGPTARRWHAVSMESYQRGRSQKEDIRD